MEKLLSTKELIAMNGGTAKTELYKILDGKETFDTYRSIVKLTTTARKPVELKLHMIHFDCPHMGPHALGIMDSEDADYGEIAWQMFENDQVRRATLPIGHIFGCWHVQLVQGEQDDILGEPSLLEDAIEKSLELFRETVLKKDKNPLYFVFYGCMGYHSPGDEHVCYETTKHFRNREEPAPAAPLHCFISEKGEDMRMFADNTLYNIFLKTNLTLYRCTKALTASPENFLAIHDAACIGNPQKKAMQVKVPVLS